MIQVLTQEQMARMTDTQVREYRSEVQKELAEFTRVSSLLTQDVRDYLRRQQEEKLQSHLLKYLKIDTNRRPAEVVHDLDRLQIEEKTLRNNAQNLQICENDKKKLANLAEICDNIIKARERKTSR